MPMLRESPSAWLLRDPQTYNHRPLSTPATLAPHAWKDIRASEKTTGPPMTTQEDKRAELRQAALEYH